MEKHFKLLAFITATVLLVTSCSISLAPTSRSRRSRSSSGSIEEPSFSGSSTPSDSSSSSESSSSSSSSSSQPTIYTITWKNYDGTVLRQDPIYEGETPVYQGDDPIRASDAQYDYTFSGWTPEVAPATGNREYTATYNSQVRRYTVVWKNYDDTIIETDENVPYGTTPHFDSDNPTRSSTVSTDYFFDGWTPEISEVTGNVSYTAKFREETRKYNITWKNYDGTILKEEKVAYGTVPSYSGETPQKEADVQYTYSFSGWSPSLVAVEGDAEYIAQFANEARKYDITWKNYDGSIIKVDKLEYGALPEYEGDTPEREPDMEYVYVFSGWSPTIIPVEGNAEYTAQFTPETRTYTVTWANYDGSVLEVDNNVPFGTLPQFDGGTPTRVNPHGIKYTFKGWDQTPVPVWCDVTYTAQYNSVASFSFDIIPYETSTGHTLSELKGAPWVNVNLAGEINKIKKPSLKDDFYAYVNYENIRYSGGSGPFDISASDTSKALNKLFNPSNGTTNIDYFYAFSQMVGAGDSSHIETYLENLDIDSYLSSKDVFASESSLLNLLPTEDGYEVQYNDGYVFGTNGLHSAIFFSQYNNYTWLSQYIDGITDTLYSTIGLELSSSEYNSLQNMEKGLTRSVYEQTYYVGSNNVYDFTVSELPWVDMQNSLLDMGLSASDNIAIRKCSYNALDDLYNNYSRETVKNAVITRLAFDYRFLIGASNYQTVNQYMTSTGFFGAEGGLFNYSGTTLYREMTKIMLQNITEQIYIELAGSDQIKSRVSLLIDDVLQGYKDLVDDMAWLSNDTKDGIRRKLNFMTYESCYSDVYINFAKLEASDAYSIGLFPLYFRYQNARLDNEANGILEDDTLWSQMPSYTVNAFYTSGRNKFVILNGLISGFLSDKVEEFYGMLGSVIGHEITHAFDSNGSQYDEYGAQRDWWTSADKNKFNNKVNKMINFYNKIDQYDNHYVDGDNVDGEATADMGGMRVMLKLAEKIPNFDYDVFFRTYAFTWCRGAINTSSMNSRIQDEHPVEYLRANVTLAQFQEFVDTYDIGPGDGMYIPENERIAIW